MHLSALADAIQAFARSLRIATIFPAGLFVTFHFYFILPVISSEGWPKLEDSAPSTLSLMIALTLVLSYLLFVSNLRLNELFQGHSLRQTNFWNRRLRRMRNQYEQLDKQVKRLSLKSKEYENHSDFDLLSKDFNKLSKEQAKRREKIRNTYWDLMIDLNDAKSKLEFNYPPEGINILPTKVGNVMAAFQSYAELRYGMGWNSIWPRLTPILREKGYYEYIARYEDAFDFLKNIYVVVLILGLELVYLNLFLDKWIFAGLSLILTGLLGDGSQIC